MQRAGLEEAVEAVLTTLGMAPCEGTDAVPPNARHAFPGSEVVTDVRVQMERCFWGVRCTQDAQSCSPHGAWRTQSPVQPT